MFIEQHVALALKKERVLGRIDEQRRRAAQDLARLKKPLALADKLVSGVLFVKERPWIAGVAGVAVAVAGRKRLFTWAGRAWTAWRVWARARQWLHAQGYLEN